MEKLVYSNVIVRITESVSLRQENVRHQDVILDGKVPPVTKFLFVMLDGLDSYVP